MSRLTDTEFLDALNDLCVEDILSMSGEKRRAEIIAEGGDPDVMAAEAREAGLRATRAAETVRADQKASAAGLPAVGGFW